MTLEFRMVAVIEWFNSFADIVSQFCKSGYGHFGKFQTSGFNRCQIKQQTSYRYLSTNVVTKAHQKVFFWNQVWISKLVFNYGENI